MLSTGYINTPREVLIAQSTYSCDVTLAFKNYRLADLLPVQNQGSLPACVGYVIDEMYQYRLRIRKETCEMKNIPQYIYRNRSNREVDGMTPVDGFTVLKESIGNPSDMKWARVTTPTAIKNALMVFGPVMLCMACRSFDAEFWKGSGLLGGHAVSIVGWNDDRFILKNSWGTEWADGGYTEISLPEINSYGQEMWVLI